MDSFFGIGFPELLLILIVAGIVMGPERIGQTARWLGRTTAQLQKISRGFVRQLNQELAGSGDGKAIQETMAELKQLRKELIDLRGEFTQTTTQATLAGKQAIDEIQNSIKPPNLKSPAATPSKSQTVDDPVPQKDLSKNAPSESSEGAATESPVNHNGALKPKNFPLLPNLLDVADDPE